MATAQQGIMALPEMSQQPPSEGVSPEQMAAVEQMRQNVSPGEFSNELLAGAAEVDPQAVAEFKKALEELDVPPEILELLNQLVDEILANPQNYEAIKEKYRAQGITDDILPEQFDPEFFAALNVAIDQLTARPAAPQGFAKGGIAELKPVAKALASYGRNGDTMLAHITPAEAAMLKRHGGSGTINPVTGLPEFFVKNLFSKIGKAVKSFTRSTVGRIVTTVALGFFLGPAAASMLGVSSVAGVAAVSGFVGSAGSTLLGGGSVRDALKAGAIGGITAGVGAGVMGGADAFASGSYTGPTTVAGQWNRAVNAFTPSAPGTPASSAPLGKMDPAAVGRAGGFDVPTGTGPRMDLMGPRATPAELMAPNINASAGALPGAAPAAAPGSAVTPTSPLVPTPPVAPPVGAPISTAATEAGSRAFGLQPSATTAAEGIQKGFAQSGTPSFLDQSKDFIKRTFSPTEIAAQGEPAAREAALKAATNMQNSLANSPLSANARDALVRSAYDKAYSAAAPGMFAKYGPMAAAGLGIMGLTGGFKQREIKSPYSDLFTGGPGSSRDLIAKNPYEYYIQNMPGVRYVNGVPVGYAAGGEVQHFQEGGMPTAQDIAAQAETQTPRLATAPAPAPAPAPAGPPVPPIGTAAAPAQVATPATGGYNLYSPAAQNMYYGALNQQLLSPSTTPAQGIAALQFPTNERLAEVEDLYRTMLGRDPDVGGLRFYANPQTNFSRQVIAEDIARSPEYAKRQAAPAAPGTPTPVDPNSPSPQLLQRTNQIRALYQQYLGRTPDESGLQFYMNPQFNMDQIQRDISNSREAQVRNLYVNLLGREPDAGGLQFYMNPQFTVDQISRDIQQSPEFLQRANRNPPDQRTPAPPDRREAQGVAPAPAPAPVAPPATGPYAAEINQGRQAIPYASGTAATREDIQRIYEDVLGRTADPGGLEFYFASQFSPAQIRENMMQSPEYLARQGGGGGGGGGGRRDLDTVVPFNMGGIASLNKGGYPRRTGQIDGPGTETSDSIPAMLSDGEFVMTAKAVRGAGGGDRRKGAKRMYALMHQLERNAARG